MVKKLRFLAIVDNTAYFFEDRTKTLLPLGISNKVVEKVLGIQNGEDALITRIFNWGHISVKEVTFCGRPCEESQSVVKVKTSEKTCEINACFPEALVLGLSQGVRFSIQDYALREQGFVITDDTLLKVLSGNPENASD